MLISNDTDVVQDEDEEDDDEDDDEEEDDEDDDEEEGEGEGEGEEEEDNYDDVPYHNGPRKKQDTGDRNIKDPKKKVRLMN
jgi:hypothetical protein